MPRVSRTPAISGKYMTVAAAMRGGGLTVNLRFLCDVVLELFPSCETRFGIRMLFLEIRFFDGQNTFFSDLDPSAASAIRFAYLSCFRDNIRLLNLDQPSFLLFCTKAICAILQNSSILQFTIDKFFEK